MKLCGLQLDIQWESKASNRERILALLDKHSVEADALVVLPEMCCTGFSMNVLETAENLGGESEQFFSRLAHDREIYLLAGWTALGTSSRGQNMATAFSPGGDLLSRYCKMHPFTFGGEGQFFESGQSVRTFPCNDVTVAPFICYDLRFPEVFRQAASAYRPEVYAVIANWPAARELHWVTLLQARAIENQAYVVGVNRCGSDPQNTYSGRSLIVDPRGQILADAGDQEVLIEADLDLADLRDYRSRFPALQDMR